MNVSDLLRRPCVDGPQPVKVFTETMISYVAPFSEWVWIVSRSTIGPCPFWSSEGVIMTKIITRF